MQTPSDWDARADEVASDVEQPEIPDRRFDVTDYGAVGDGETDDAEAVAETIATCTVAGGGQVYVPPGDYHHAGPIHLEDGVDLHLAPGATVRFSTSPSDYLPVVFSRWSGMELLNHSPMVYANDKSNVAVTGEGTLDAQAGPDAWWPWFEQEREVDPDFDELGRLMAEGVPPEERVFGEGTALRPPMVQFYDCDHVLLEGVTLRNSPYWMVNPVLTDHVTARGVTFDTPEGPNTDGFNPESCNHVLVEGCSFDNGDDCVTVKSGRNEDGWRVDTPTRNVVVQDCHFGDGYGGIVVGSEVSGGAHDLYVRRNVFASEDQWRMLRIKTNSRRGGVVERVYLWENEVHEVSRDQVKVNLAYEHTEVGEPVGDHPPVVRDVHVAGVESDADAPVVNLRGVDRSAVENVSIRDSSFPEAHVGSWNEHVAGLVFDGVVVGSDRSEADLVNLQAPTYDDVGDVSMVGVTDPSGVRVGATDPHLRTVPAETGADTMVDGGPTVESLPAELRGGVLVQGASNHADLDAATHPAYLQFDATRPVTVYAALDGRREGSWPAWLDDWTSTGLRVDVSGWVDEPYVVFERSFEAGQVTLGPNAGDGSVTSYFAVVVPEDDPSPSSA